MSLATSPLLALSRRRAYAERPLCADIVAKVENRATRKISRKLILALLPRCVAFQRQYGDPWSILDETIWFPHVAARKTHPRL